MKIRMGFVSNSSSSSYVIVLPENFAISSINFAEFADDDYTEDDIRADVLELMNGGELWDGDGCSSCLMAVKESLSKYVVATIDGGANDCRSMVCISNDKIREIWEGNENED